MQTNLSNPAKSIRIDKGWSTTVPDNNKRYRIVAVSLYSNEVIEADRLTEILRDAGWPKANRSLVVREGLSLLFETLAGKEPEDVFRYFLERRAQGANRRGKAS